MDETSYVARHIATLEAILSSAVVQVIKERAADPTLRLSEIIVDQAKQRAAAPEPAVAVPDVAAAAPSPAAAEQHAQAEPVAGALADIESLAGANTPRGRRDEWTIDKFAASLGISRCISEALRHEDTGGSELELMKSFASRDAIQRRLVAGKLADRVADFLWEGEQKLLTAAADSGAQLNAKFAADGDAFKGKMGFGGLEQFFAGLEGIIGGPKMLEGSLLKAILLL